MKNYSVSLRKKNLLIKTYLLLVIFRTHFFRYGESSLNKKKKIKQFDFIICFLSRKIKLLEVEKVVIVLNFETQQLFTKIKVSKLDFTKL